MSQHTHKIGILGGGRVGAVLGAALRARGHRIAAVSGTSPATRLRAAALLPRIPVLPPQEVVKHSDTILLTVPDDHLENIAKELSPHWREGQVALHTSGAHGTAVLAAAVERGAHPIAAHPAMTFSGTRNDLSLLPGTTWAVTGKDPALIRVEELIRDTGGVPERLGEQERTLYHAALAGSANHLVTLVADALDLLAASGITDPARLLQPLLGAALQRTLEEGDHALTGPIRRGDTETLATHLATLHAEAPGAAETYRSLAERTAVRAHLSGTITPGTFEKVLEVLHPSTDTSSIPVQSGEAP